MRNKEVCRRNKEASLVVAPSSGQAAHYHDHGAERRAEAAISRGPPSQCRRCQITAMTKLLHQQLAAKICLQLFSSLYFAELCTQLPLGLPFFVNALQTGVLKTSQEQHVEEEEGRVLLDVMNHKEQLEREEDAQEQATSSSAATTSTASITGASTSTSTSTTSTASTTTSSSVVASSTSTTTISTTSSTTTSTTESPKGDLDSIFSCCGGEEPSTTSSTTTSTTSSSTTTSSTTSTTTTTSSPSTTTPSTTTTTTTTTSTTTTSDPRLALFDDPNKKTPGFQQCTPENMLRITGASGADMEEQQPAGTTPATEAQDGGTTTAPPPPPVEDEQTGAATNTRRTSPAQLQSEANTQCRQLAGFVDAKNYPGNIKGSVTANRDRFFNAQLVEELVAIAQPSPFFGPGAGFGEGLIALSVAAKGSSSGAFMKFAESEGRKMKNKTPPPGTASAKSERETSYAALYRGFLNNKNVGVVAEQGDTRTAPPTAGTGGALASNRDDPVARKSVEAGLQFLDVALDWSQRVTYVGCCDPPSGVNKLDGAGQLVAQGQQQLVRTRVSTAATDTPDSVPSTKSSSAQQNPLASEEARQRILEDAEKFASDYKKDNEAASSTSTGDSSNAGMDLNVHLLTLKPTSKDVEATRIPHLPGAGLCRSAVSVLFDKASADSKFSGPVALVKKSWASSTCAASGEKAKERKQQQEFEETKRKAEESERQKKEAAKTSTTTSTTTTAPLYVLDDSPAGANPTGDDSTTGSSSATAPENDQQPKINLPQPQQQGSSSLLQTSFLELNKFRLYLEKKLYEETEKLKKFLFSTSTTMKSKRRRSRIQEVFNYKSENEMNLLHFASLAQNFHSSHYNMIEVLVAAEAKIEYQKEKEKEKKASTSTSSTSTTSSPSSTTVAAPAGGSTSSSTSTSSSSTTSTPATGEQQTDPAQQTAEEQPREHCRKSGEFEFVQVTPSSSADPLKVFPPSVAEILLDSSKWATDSENLKKVAENFNSNKYSPGLEGEDSAKFGQLLLDNMKVFEEKKAELEMFFATHCCVEQEMMTTGNLRGSAQTTTVLVSEQQSEQTNLQKQTGQEEEVAGEETRTAATSAEVVPEQIDGTSPADGTAGNAASSQAPGGGRPSSLSGGETRATAVGVTEAERPPTTTLAAPVGAGPTAAGVPETAFSYSW
ncbi:unnamed protein product [Amoebophrya sp. A120]|nr:unnamed protein product [Amoebophrya sp. A120]|eukprot:GSA120T00012573001.1